MKYKVITNEIKSQRIIYIVEANSEEEVNDMDYYDLQLYFDNEEYDGLESCEIESIEPLEDE